jgi:hypothetical protein
MAGFNHCLETGLLERDGYDVLWMVSKDLCIIIAMETGLKDSQEAFNHCLQTGLLERETKGLQ